MEMNRPNFHFIRSPRIATASFVKSCKKGEINSTYYMCCVNAFPPLKSKSKSANNPKQGKILMAQQSVNTIAESVQHAVMLFMDVVTAKLKNKNI